MLSLFKKKFSYENVPIIIPCCERSQFLLRCLDHLTFAKGIENFTVHFCIDVKKRDKVGTKECVKLCENWSRTEKVIHMRKKLFSGTQNSTGAIKHVLDYDENVEAFIYIEEDVIVGVNFLNFCLEALNKYEKNEYVFGVSGFSRSEKGFEEMGVDPAIPCMIGFAGWKNRIEWSMSKFDDFVQAKESLIKHMHKIRYPKESKELKSFINRDGVPDNPAGAGLLLANQITDGRVTIVSRPALCDHIGWHGWHFDSGERRDLSLALPPERAMKRHVHAQTFNPFNDYKLPKVKKEILSKFLNVPISIIKKPEGLRKVK